jgi:hypothetical protein
MDDAIRRSRERALFVRPRMGILTVIGMLRQLAYGRGFPPSLSHRP